MTNEPERAMLQSLADSAPYLVPENTLYAETCNRLTRTLSYDGFRDLLLRAKDKRRIDSLASEDGLRWGITPDGLFRLRQMP